MVYPFLRADIKLGIILLQRMWYSFTGEFIFVREEQTP